MSTRITHFKKQPVNVQFWDYYILCRLNSDVTIAVQRMEFWDGTKEDGNGHAEDINDALAAKNQPTTQDTSRWIYKSEDAIQWELMGIAGEKRTHQIMTFLIDDLQFLKKRSNPLNTWDRKKQYEFQEKTVQEQINYLGYIIDYFDLPLRRLIPVFYAIEALTRAGIYIDTISVEKVLQQLEDFKTTEKIPHFLKDELGKFFQTYQGSQFRPFRTFAEWKAHFCGMHNAEMRNGKRNNAESIPQKRGSNSIEYYIEDNIKDEHNLEENTAPAIAERTPPSSLEKKGEEFSQSPSEEKPAKKGRSKKPSLELVPVPPPARPSEDMEWGPEKMLAWGDYARGGTLSVSNRHDSKYFKAREAACKSCGRGITENSFLVIFFNWMKGIDLDLKPLPAGALKSETWPDYHSDLWIFDEHYEDEARKYKKAKGSLEQVTPQANTPAQPKKMKFDHLGINPKTMKRFVSQEEKDQVYREMFEEMQAHA